MEGSPDPVWTHPGLEGGREGGREGKASELLESLGGCLFRVLTGLDRRRFDITS